MWSTLTDLMGSSATAVLVKRAIKRAAGEQPAVQMLVIRRPVFDYEYLVPETWKDNGKAELAALMGALVPLLKELTGEIAVSRLRSIPELAQSGLLDGANGR